MTIGLVAATLVLEDTYTNEIKLHGPFNVSISGIVDDTVTLQRSIDGGTVWKDVESYESDHEDMGWEVESGWIYRLGIKVGHRGTGTVLVRISF